MELSAMISTPYLVQLLGDSSVMNLNVPQNHAVKKSVVQWVPKRMIWLYVNHRLNCNKRRYSYASNHHAVNECIRNMSEKLAMNQMQRKKILLFILENFSMFW